MLSACARADTHGAAPAAGARRFARDAVTPAWTLPLSDTAVISPTFLSSDGGVLYLSDPGARAVLAFDARTGRRLWRSSADGDVHPRPIAALRAGGVAYGDERTGELTLLDTAGAVRARIASTEVTHFSSFCELPGGTFLLSGVNGTSSLAVVDRRGHVVRALALPWPDLHGVLTSGAWLAGAPTGCVAALVYGRGFARFAADSFARPSRYVEYFDVPEERETTSRSGDTLVTSRQIVTHRVAASDAAVDGSLLAVSFEGESDVRAHVIDLYRLPDGAYLGSRKLRRRPLAFTMRAGVAYALSRTPEGFELTAWRESLGADASLAADDGRTH